MADAHLFRIAGGNVYDPANGIDGEVRDLWIQAGKIVEKPTDPGNRASRTLDVRGCIVFPGGVDMHSHIAGPKVNAARKLCPDHYRQRGVLSDESKPSVRGVVPTTFQNGLGYSGLGYTTVFDAAVPPLFARQAHLELSDTPVLDKGFLALVGNNHFAMNCISACEQDQLDDYLSWLLNATKAYGFKAVNPCGIEEWKQSRRRRMIAVDDVVSGFDVTPRSIIRECAAAIDRLKLPHALHIHSNNLGMPGNSATTMDSLRALEGHRGHFAHLQFHSYAGGEESDFSSDVPKLAKYLEEHPEISFDVGHTTFGQTLALTGDGPLAHFLHRVSGGKWFSCDTESESGCGVVPIEYKHRSLFHSVQWAVGLEWYLLSPDLWRTAFSTDHPNGGTFLRYPETIKLLMNADYRKEQLAKAHPELPKRSQLLGIDRELKLYEIAILTRAAPARILGLGCKGHLGTDADADVTIYQPHADIARMFSLPRYVIKSGAIVLDDGEIRQTEPGCTHASHSNREISNLMPGLKQWFESHHSIQLSNFGVSDDWIDRDHLRSVVCP